MTANRQLTLDLAFEPSLSDESFILAPGNAAAADMVARWPHWRAPALLLVGPAGSGKSHLARIWANRSGAALRRAADIRLETVEDLAERPAVAVEDMPDSAADETALFHLHNLLRERGHTLLITSRTPASAWRVDLPDLRSRFNAMPLALIEAPDDALLAQLAIKLFADRQVDVAPEVIGYVLKRMDRSPDAVQRLVEAADRLSLAAKRPITRSVITEALRSLETDAA